KVILLSQTRLGSTMMALRQK
ncbi:hypothetical protein VCHC50A2_1894B, partial [Vibrio cholerae HC-50A2]